MPRSLKEILAQAEELADRFEAFTPAPGDRRKAVALAKVHRMALAKAEAEAKLESAVHSARTEGASWRILGHLLGTTGEAARQRYGSRPGRRQTRERTSRGTRRYR